MVSDVRVSWKGVASCHVRSHKHCRCCRVHVKVRTGGERVQVWIGLGQGEFRVNRAACRCNWGAQDWVGCHGHDTETVQ